MMHNHIRMIYKVLDSAKGNVGEAERHVETAQCMKHEHRAIADWYIEMAKKHLEFNEKTHALIDEYCRELHDMAGDSELHAAMAASIHEYRAWINQETMEVRTMIELYSR